MHAAVARRRQMPLRIDDERKARLEHRTVRQHERRKHVGRAVGRCRCDLRIRADERIRVRARAGTARGRLRMACAATGRVVARPEAMARCVGLRSVDGIDLDEAVEPVLEVLLLRAAQCRERQPGTETTGAGAGIACGIVVLESLRVCRGRCVQSECNKDEQGRQGRRRGLHQTSPQGCPADAGQIGPLSCVRPITCSPRNQPMSSL